MTKSVRDRMKREMAQKELFNTAQAYAYEYADQVAARNVYPSDAALANLACFDEPLPAGPGDGRAILTQMHEVGSPATVAQTGGRYFGFVNGGVLPAALAARWLSDFWDQNTALRVMSPVVAKVEEITEGWLRELLNLPPAVVAGFVSGSSLAIFCGLAAARYRLLAPAGWDVNRKGLNGAPDLRIVAGRHAHGTVLKAVALLGLGLDNVEWVESDEQGRMIAAQVPALDDRTLLILQAGNVSSGAFDPFDELCAVANAANAWVHIDGAFGLWAAASPALAHLTRGMGKANSWSVDGHKTLNAPYDSGIVLCNDADALIQALQATGSYIAYSGERDGMLYTPEMSRRARAVELWAALKYLGRSGVDELILGMHARAVQFGRELAAAGFEILNDVVFNQVIVACANDELTIQTMQHVQQSGECWAGGAHWHDRAMIRISVCSWVTTPDDVTRTVAAFVAARKRALTSPPQ